MCEKGRAARVGTPAGTKPKYCAARILCFAEKNATINRYRRFARAKRRREEECRG